MLARRRYPNVWLVVRLLSALSISLPGRGSAGCPGCCGGVDQADDRGGGGCPGCCLWWCRSGWSVVRCSVSFRVDLCGGIVVVLL